MKKILTLPVKNEEWILERSLAAAVLYFDHIIVADQGSTDASRSICQKFPQVKLIEDTVSVTYGQIRQVLLTEARKIAGEGNAIFCLDADEILTANILSDNFSDALARLKPGSAILLQWINLWGSIKKYRQDDSVWSDSWKHFILIDDRQFDFSPTALFADHTYRLPEAYVKNTVKFDYPKVLHFQFINLSRMSSKQCYNRMKDFLPTGGFGRALRINHRYFPARWDKKIKLADTPIGWYNDYGRDTAALIDTKEIKWEWYDTEIFELFKKYGLKKFIWLDIWGVDWRKKADFLPTGERDLFLKLLTEAPRPVYVKFYHRFGQKILEKFYHLFL